MAGEVTVGEGDAAGQGGLEWGEKKVTVDGRRVALGAAQKGPAQPLLQEWPAGLGLQSVQWTRQALGGSSRKLLMKGSSGGGGGTVKGVRPRRAVEEVAVEATAVVHRRTVIRHALGQRGGMVTVTWVTRVMVIAAIAAAAAAAAAAVAVVSVAAMLPELVVDQEGNLAADDPESAWAWKRNLKLSGV